MPCKDCFDNCDRIVSDQCVQYTGPEIPLLGVCTGDTLFKFEEEVVKKLLSFIDGTGITPKDLTIDCEWLEDQLGFLPKDLNNVLQLLIDSSCTLKQLVDSLSAQLADNTVFNTACLVGLPSNPTRDNILQAAVNMLCAMKVTVDAIPTTYVKVSDIDSLVTNIVTNILAGEPDEETPVNQFYLRAIPYVAMEYYGSIGNFDSSGKGLANLGWDKMYLCNGNNGTPDRRGRVGVGALRGVPGGSMDTAVDPSSNPNNPNWALNDKYGKSYETLTLAQIPNHNHTITDPGHKHNIDGVTGGDDNNNNNTSRFAGGDKNNEAGFFFTNTTGMSTSTTGITIASTGGGQPHNNVQPSIAALYIMYIP